MASRSAPPCTHELRPGTTVCLRCQHAERATHRARQRRMIARGAAGTLLLAVIAAIGIAGASALRARSGAGKSRESLLSGDVSGTATPDTTAQVSAESGADSTASMPTIRRVATDSVSGSPIAKASPPPAAGPAPLAPSVASAASLSTAASSHPVAPLVPVGRTVLRDTMVADRAGDTVRVSFDLLLSRTRRPDKFEAIVRSTLPQVYGAPADSALRVLPVGAVARAGDLMTTLPDRGFRIPLTDGRAIAVWPETRVGRDGPLVVAYRAVASR